MDAARLGSDAKEWLDRGLKKYDARMDALEVKNERQDQVVRSHLKCNGPVEPPGLV